MKGPRSNGQKRQFYANETLGVARSNEGPHNSSSESKFTPGAGEKENWRAAELNKHLQELELGDEVGKLRCETGLILFKVLHLHVISSRALDPEAFYCDTTSNSPKAISNSSGQAPSPLEPSSWEEEPTSTQRVQCDEQVAQGQVFLPLLWKFSSSEKLRLGGWQTKSKMRNCCAQLDPAIQDLFFSGHISCDAPFYVPLENVHATQASSYGTQSIPTASQAFLQASSNIAIGVLVRQGTAT